MKKLGYLVVGFVFTFISVTLISTIFDTKDETASLSSRITAPKALI
jgi:hypothetical protein